MDIKFLNYDLGIFFFISQKADASVYANETNLFVGEFLSLRFFFGSQEDVNLALQFNFR